MTTVMTAEPQPDVGIKSNEEFVRLPDGRVIHRVHFNYGNVSETTVWFGDYEEIPGTKPNAKGEQPMQRKSGLTITTPSM